MTTRTLDYGTHDPFSGTIGRPRNLAWPVHAYRITIPTTVSAGRDLNPFERVILKVIDAVGQMDDRRLAEETRIPADLVRSVVLRLRDKGLLDEDNLVIDRQRRRWEGDTRDDTYTSALAFRELVGGNLLPFVHVLDDTSPLRTKVVKRPIWTLTLGPDARRTGPPSTRDVIDVIAQMRKRSEAHARVTRIPTVEQVRVEREPEDYLLDCSIAIQAHDTEFRIADPFGTGFSRILEETLTRHLVSDEPLREWMDRWYDTLSTPRQHDRQPVPGQPFATAENWRRYPQLVRALTPQRGAQRRTVEDIYASLEWALFYTCETCGPDLAIERLRQEDAGTGYSRWMSDVAEAVGFVRPEGGFRPVPAGKLRDYTDQKPEMETVLAIALLQAEVDPEHPMHAVARFHPEFVVRIRALASDRGDRAHGARVTASDGSPLASDPFMREAICTLLPTVQFGTEPADTSPATQADLRLDARNSLRGELGHQAFHRLGPSAKTSLVEAEQFWLLSEDGDDARAFVSNLYSALQGVLRAFLTGAAPVSAAQGQYTSYADANAVRAGLGPLPEGLTSVNPRRIRETLLGNDLSVGASTIALLLTAGESSLQEIAAAQPDFLAVVADIHARRGHGNVSMPLSKREVGRVRRRTLTTLVTLLELTHED